MERFILYFIAGIITTGLETLNVRFIAKEKALKAAMITFAVVLIGFSVIYDILANLQQGGYIGIVVYAVGVGFGSYLGIKVKIK